MNYLLLFLLFTISSTLSYAQQDKPIISRGEDKLAKVFVNVVGTLTESASFGDPANCAASGALICSGRYTPIKTNVINLSSSSVNTMTFIRVGNMVNVSGPVVGAPITVSGSMDLSLPIPSDLVSSGDLDGNGVTNSSGTKVFITPDGGVDIARVSVTNASATNQTWYFSFQYEIK